jgi:acetyl-CoA carboxylase biotin carboxyl carrier protein
MSNGAPKQRRTAADDFGLEAVRELLRMIAETDITEIQIERGDSKLTIKRGAQGAPQLLMAPAPQHAAPAHPPAPAQPVPLAQSAASGPQADHEPLPAGQVIAAPMVGTFYASPSPKDPVYVHEGDTVHVGDKVGIIEAMKMMNEIESEFAGRVVRVLVKNGQPVEFGQPLMVIEPL